MRKHRIISSSAALAEPGLRSLSPPDSPQFLRGSPATATRLPGVRPSRGGRHDRKPGRKDGYSFVQVAVVAARRRNPALARRVLSLSPVTLRCGLQRAVAVLLLTGSFLGVCLPGRSFSRLMPEGPALRILGLALGFPASLSLSTSACLASSFSASPSFFLLSLAFGFFSLPCPPVLLSSRTDTRERQGAR